jgi:hypothetical protein
MNWQPESEECADCGFLWTCSPDDALRIVRGAVRTIEAVTGGHPSTVHRLDRAWSAAEYCWHLADAIRIGAERTWTAINAPDQRLVCFDQDGLAQARHYDELDPETALWSLARAVGDLDHALRPSYQPRLIAAPSESVSGIVRRLAHEVVHHVEDIRVATEPS